MKTIVRTFLGLLFAAGLGADVVYILQPGLKLPVVVFLGGSAAITIAVLSVVVTVIRSLLTPKKKTARPTMPAAYRYPVPANPPMPPQPSIPRKVSQPLPLPQKPPQQPLPPAAREMPVVKAPRREAARPQRYDFDLPDDRVFADYESSLEHLRDYEAGAPHLEPTPPEPYVDPRAPMYYPFADEAEMVAARENSQTLHIPGSDRGGSRAQQQRYGYGNHQDRRRDKNRVRSQRGA